MTWVRLDDKFPDHPKVQHVSDPAGWLFVCGLCYCARQTTDGFIPGGKVNTLTRAARSGKLAGELVAIGLWEETPGGFLIHDYLEYQPSAAQLNDKRDKEAVRKKSYRMSQRDIAQTESGTGTGPLTGAPACVSGYGVGQDNGFEDTAELDAAIVVLCSVWQDVDRVGVENAWATDPSADVVAAARLAAVWGSDDKWTMGAAASLRSAMRKLHAESSAGRSKAERGADGVAAISRLMGGQAA